MASEKGLTLATVLPLYMAVYIKQMPDSKPTIKQKLAVAPWMTHAIIMGRGFGLAAKVPLSERRSITQDALPFGQQCNPLDESQARQSLVSDFPLYWL